MPFQRKMFDSLHPAAAGSINDQNTRRFVRNQTTWLAYLLLAFFSYFLNIFGPITPFLKEELNLSYTVSSLHFTAFAVGMLLVGLVGHLLIQRVGRQPALWIGTFGMSLSALLLATGRSAFMTIATSFSAGVMGSLILAIVPSWLSDQHGEQRTIALAESNLAGSLAGAASALLVGWAQLFAGNWRLALIVMAFTPLLIASIFWKNRLSREISSEEKTTQEASPLPSQYWVYWTALVLAVSVEFCMIFWSADFLEHSLRMFKTGAAQAVSLFLAGMIIGRMAGSRLVQHFSTQKLLVTSVLLAGAGFLIYWMGGTVLVGLTGLFITGLGVASLYPLILSLAIGSAKENTVKASARATLASGVAILALPLVLGRLADAFGIRTAYSIVGLLLIGVFLTVLFAERRFLIAPKFRPN